MPDYTFKHLPYAIYLDTSILRSAGIDLSKPWMSELRSFANKWSISLCITELVLDEWCEHVFETLNGQYQRLLGAADNLKDFQINVTIPNDSPKSFPDKGTLKNVIRTKLTGIGFSIIPNWTGPVEQIIAEAVNKTPPFEKGGKGFCDMIILESYILHALQQSSNPRIVVVSNDEAIRKSQNRLSSRGIAVKLLGENEILDGLKQLLNSEEAAFQAEREAQLTAFVMKHESEILAFVNKSPLKFTNLWLSNTLSQEGRLQGSIQDVLSAKPTKISKVVGGAPVFREQVPKNRYPVEIWIDMDLDVMVSETNLYDSLFKPLAIAEPEKIGEGSPLKLDHWPISTPKETRMTIKRNVYVEATVNEAGVDRGEYEDLKLETVR